MYIYGIPIDEIVKNLPDFWPRDLSNSLLQEVYHIARALSGSHWDNDPDYPPEDWRNEVANGDTRQSYQDWVAHQKDAAEDE